ncbi:MAG: hypothetical protein LBH10_06830 [Burkholderiaceae bacterium]|nr:hypothetical protein [Burkholderiaceae bacterium]
MTNEKISAIVIAALAAGGISGWALTQAQSRHVQPGAAVAAASPQPAVLAVAAASEPALAPVAASASVAAAANPALPQCDCPQPVRPKHHAKLKKAHRRYQSPEPVAAPVAVAPPPAPVYNPPVVVAPPPVVVGDVAPAYYYGYGGYPIVSFGYYGGYGGYGGRYWGNGGPRFTRSGLAGRAMSRGSYGGGSYGHRR